MITEQDLEEAIAECQGQRNPNANTCIKLAAFYTIKEHLFGAKPINYSYSAPEIREEKIASYESDTEFAQAIQGMDWQMLLPVVDELMSTLQITNPRLYSAVMRKVDEL